MTDQVNLSSASPDLIAQWQEPVKEAETQPIRLKKRWFIGAAILASGFGVLGFWQHDFNYFFASIITIVALIALIKQSHYVEPSLAITLTNSQLSIGPKTHLLSEFAGFWLQSDHQAHLIINFEYPKPALLPVSCYFPTNDPSQARQILLQVLPELEPRNTHFSENWYHLLGN